MQDLCGPAFLSGADATSVVFVARVCVYVCVTLRRFCHTYPSHGAVAACNFVMQTPIKS